MRPRTSYSPVKRQWPAFLLPLLMINLFWISSTSAAPGIRLTAKDGTILTPFSESWAVVIGIDDYEHMRKLKFAVSDARGVRDLLVSRFSFSPDKVLTLYNEQATKRAILGLLGDDIPNRTRLDDRLFIYFAGHGVTRHKTGYILPVDAKGGRYRATAISMTELRDILRDIPCKHLYLVLDACYSGMFFTTRAATVKDSHPRYLLEITKRKARQALTAGGKESVSDEGYQGHSVFTGYFIEALERGIADYNGDGIITASEIASYVLPQVADRSQQTPEYGQLPGSEGGEFFFVAKVDPRIEETRRRLDALKRDESDARENLTRLEGERDSLLQKIRKEKERLKTIQREINTLQTFLQGPKRVSPPSPPPSKPKASVEVTRPFSKPLPSPAAAKAPPPELAKPSPLARFIDNGDGTVTDTKTGLMWQKGGSKGALTYRRAEDYVYQLSETKFKGYSDWRIPELDDLKSIILDSPVKGMMIDISFDRRVRNSWSSTEDGGGEDCKRYFGIDLRDGTLFTGKTSIASLGYCGGSADSYYIRSVRGPIDALKTK